jgi:hypothetical protein
MTADFAYGPVTVFDEANGVGETAVLFAEICQIMRIPLVTSVWRGLADMDDSRRLGLGVVEPTGRRANTTGASVGLGWCVILPPKRGGAAYLGNPQDVPRLVVGRFSLDISNSRSDVAESS